jgi:CRISPR-associated endonuclease/helicase Cas3
MEPECEGFFRHNFERLTGTRPYVWQRKLFASMAAPESEWPEAIDLPTGAGKTSVLHVWLLALAHSIRAGTHHVPRRLAWVVNRRVVVDQVTAEVEALVRPVNGEPSRLERCPEVREPLRSVSHLQLPLAVSTLRGEFADNGDWSRDPSTPAVVVGTFDMIGSRLLFRGYRSGRYHRPVHTGLLGVDALIVNDEAHLTPAFVQLLRQIGDFAPAKQFPGKRFRRLLLSATQTDVAALRRFEHDPREDAAENEHFSSLLHAPKRLALVPADSAATLEAERWRLATTSPAPRTIIFIDAPEKAAQFAARLAKAGFPSVVLTGTMRGHERDGLVSQTVFQQFLGRQSPPDPVFLVGTSAGEVGVNLTCERLITDLREADHVLQRLGRLNRFGSATGGEGFVLYRAGEKDERLQAALRYLGTLSGDASCGSLWERRPPCEACSAVPRMARLDSRLLDIWAQTTYRDPFVPPVEPYLHGELDEETPETEIAWRADLETLLDWKVSDDLLERVFEYYPVRSAERLREPTSRVKKKISEIVERLGDAAAERQAVIVAADGSCSRQSLAAIADQERDTSLRNALVVLPPGTGSIAGGMFQPEEQESVFDVADFSPERRGLRLRWSEGAFTIIGRSGTYEEDRQAVPDDCSREALARFAVEHNFKAPLLIAAEDGDEALVYFARKGLGQMVRTDGDLSLAKHRQRVAERALEIARSLRLGDGLQEAFHRAGLLHDEGKHRDNWQRAMGGSMAEPVAKSRGPVNTRLINLYRHELGSLVTALANGEALHPDLIAHLIASHHSGARPFFTEEQFDKVHLQLSARAAHEAALRFARLQNAYGHWGLAYLEAAFKCADGLASAEEGEPASA